MALALDDLTGWETNLEALLEATGGPLRPDEQAWVDRILYDAGGTGPAG